MTIEKLQSNQNYLFHFNKNFQLLLLLILGLGFYVNSIGNDYALDDGLVISDNPYTLKGLGGIADIFTHDSYYGFYQKYGSNGELSGGRYRPLSITTFAIEYEFFGLNPHLSHAVNVLLYLLSILVLYLLLSKYWFPDKRWLPFFITLLFTIHPLHTEAVANIKGRDEILSLLLLLCSLFWLFKYVGNRSSKRNALLFSLFAYGLALFSKENGITFLALIPLSLFVFAGMKFKQSLKTMLPYLLVALIYLFIRYQVVGFGAENMNNIMNNPFASASWSQKYASIFFILLYYLRLLVFPNPLSYDYGFNTFPYRDFGDFWVLFSILLQASFLIYALMKINKRNVIAFAILYYFITLSIVSNLFINLGGTMGERLIYHSSLGFVMLIALTGEKVFLYLSRFNKAFARTILMLIVISLIVLSAFKTISRNKDWNDNDTLFIKDVTSVPNSVKANVAASTAYISMADKTDIKTKKDQYLKKAERLLIHAKSIYPGFADIYMNLGGIYYRQENYEAAEMAWLKGKDIQPNHPNLPQYFKLLGSVFYKEGLQKGSIQNFEDAEKLLKKSAAYMPGNAEIWYNLGGAQYSLHDYRAALKSFEKAVKLRPGYEEAIRGQEAVKLLLQ